jgi:hypothetical protein
MEVDDDVEKLFPVHAHIYGTSDTPFISPSRLTRFSRLPHILSPSCQLSHAVIYVPALITSPLYFPPQLLIDS